MALSVDDGRVADSTNNQIENDKLSAVLPLGLIEFGGPSQCGKGLVRAHFYQNLGAAIWMVFQSVIGRY